MRVPVLVVAGLALAGCSGGVEFEPLTEGEVQAADTPRSASAVTYRAFGFATNGTGLVFISPNPDATCDDVVDYLTADGGAFDPSGVLVANHCSLRFKFRYADGEGFDGRTYTHTDDPTGWNINCAMGEGTWTLQGEGREREYQFTADGEGGWWQGDARGGYSTTVTATEEANVPALDVAVGPDLGGQFIYEDVDPDPATGTVTGAFETERCAALPQTPIWN